MEFDLPVRETEKVTFDPKTSEMSDIFEHKQACSLWVKYRKSHIISQNGLAFLNEKCRELIKLNKDFSRRDAKDFLESFIFHMSNVENSMLEPEGEWIEETANYLVGYNVIVLEQSQPNSNSVKIGDEEN